MSTEDPVPNSPTVPSQPVEAHVLPSKGKRKLTGGELLAEKGASKQRKRKDPPQAGEKLLAQSIRAHASSVKTFQRRSLHKQREEPPSKSEVELPPFDFEDEEEEESEEVSLVRYRTRRPNPSPQVRTIFIAGLPEDVKERELQNLLRWLPGYEASQVNHKGEHPMGFALFTAPTFAIAARDALQDMIFDTHSNAVLHTEMAKKNLFVKRGIVADSNAYDQSKRMRTAGDYTHAHAGYSSPSPFHPSPAPVWGPHGYMTPAPPPTYDPYAGFAPVPLIAPAPTPSPAPSSYLPVQNIKDNPPCNTLFIGNLGENINEDELRGLFWQAGFKQMKVVRQERHTVCFIEFEDTNSATRVHHNLQGAVIPSCGSVGMRIQFSKNPFGKRKDFSHLAASPSANGSSATPTYK